MPIRNYVVEVLSDGTMIANVTPRIVTAPTEHGWEARCSAPGLLQDMTFGPCSTEAEALAAVANGWRERWREQQ